MNHLYHHPRIKLLSLWIAVGVLLLLINTVNSSEEDTAVTYGSVVKIRHVDTLYELSSETKNLGTGSGQQLVTFVDKPSSSNTLWWVRPAHHGHEAEYAHNVDNTSLASPIPCQSIVRLTHLDTMRNLHSHGVTSPLSRQQEVTAYGQGDGKGDGGDNWRVECDHKYWTRNQDFRLFHMDTQSYLGTAKNVEFNQNTCGMQCPIMGHLEAFGRKGKDKHGLFQVDQGVHIRK